MNGLPYIITYLTKDINHPTMYSVLKYLFSFKCSEVINTAAPTNVCIHCFHSVTTGDSGPLFGPSWL